jgi:hypothetical protein
MASFEKNRPSTTIIDHEIAETINNEERTAVHTPELDIEKQKKRSDANRESSATATPTLFVIEIPDGGAVAWGTVFGAYVSPFLFHCDLLAAVGV